MDKWTIRPARTGDFEAVVRMIAELMDFQGLEGETPVEAAVLERDVLQNGHPSVAVAEAAGELVGYVLYFPTYSSRYGRPCRYIEDVYVKAAHRGRGIGGALMRYVIDEAAAQGCLRVEWSCLDGNEAARRIRALSRPDASTVPIIAMTANAFSEDVEKALASGMDDVATKPLDIKLLLKKIATIKEREGIS